MTKKQIFIEVLDDLFGKTDMETFCGEKYNEFNEYWESFKEKKEKDPNALTEKGMKVLEYMQKNYEVLNNRFTANKIGAGISTTGRSVSGSMNKLITIKLVEKIAGNPVIYTLTEEGKNRKIEE